MTAYNSSLAGLYVITNNDPLPLLLQKLEVAFSAGIALLQYRRKNTWYAAQLVEARAVQALCTTYHIPLIINDNISMAAQLGCGVHLGQADGSIEEARHILGEHAIIGRTCHGSLDFAKAAWQQGASYVALGAVYPSRSKDVGDVVALDTLKACCMQLPVPVCAIGGLTAHNAKPVLATGVQLCAVIDDVLNAPAAEVAARVAAWQGLFRTLNT